MNGETKGLKAWIDARFPIKRLWEEHASQYFVPKTLNFWYFFGIFSTVVLINQILTGIWLTMYYTPTSADAFNSVEHIMRDVQFGWLLRYMHSTGASALFVVIYLHMYRSVIYGSFKKPRELVWIFGMLLYSLLFLESGSGYVLPWGQMSYWATKVLTSVYSVVPWIGQKLVLWVQGDFNVTGITLHRFFALHVIAFPLLIVFVVVLHIASLHRVGSNNPDGVDGTNPKDKIPFHPYFTVKDFMGVIGFLIVFFVVVFFVPTFFGYLLEPTNVVPANPLMTPSHIVPPWYLALYYSMLRAIPNKLLGVLLSLLAVVCLFVMPWLDRSQVRSHRYRGVWTKVSIVTFVLSFIMLSALGTMPITSTVIWLSRIFMIFYFLYFLAMPIYTKYEKTKPLPERLQ